MSNIPRRTWAPFVGAALAALTAGSLVVFSLVAQRTSLDGFPERPGAAPADTSDDGRPASITIAPIANGQTEEAAAETELAGDAELEGQTAVSLIEVAQIVPTTTVALETTTRSSPSDTSNRAGLTPRGDTGGFDGRFRADGILLANRSGGGDSVDREWDGRHNGKHSHKSHDVKSKKNDGKNDKRKKNGKHKTKNFKAKGNNGHGHRSGQPRHASSSSSSAGGSHGKGHSSPPPRPQPSPDRSAKPSGGGSPPAHSNAGGNGKSRDRGHKKH